MNPFLSVRFRLFALCAGLLVVLGGANVLLGTIIQQYEPRQQLQQEQFRRVESINAAHRAVSQYRHAQGNLNATILAGNPELQISAQASLDKESARLNETLGEIESFDSETAKIIRESMAELKLPMAAAIQAFIDRDQVRSKQFFGQTKILLDRVESALSQATQRELNRAAEVQESSFQRAQSAQALSLAIIVAAGIIGLVLTFLIVRSIIQPLEKTVVAIRKVNAGETELDLPPVGRDEFGDMAVALRQFRDHAERLRDLAYRDALTGLGNRTFCEAALREAMEAHRIDGKSLGVLYIDLDNFRTVNDSLGHSAGDRYLCEAALRLQRFVPMGTEVCRYSGDKFTVLIEDLQLTEPAAGLRTIAETIQRGMNEPFHLAGNVLPMSVSIGVSMFPTDGEEAEGLVSAADAAMYRAKRNGRNNIQFANPELTADARKQMAIAADIRRGLELGEFEPFYQPVVNAVDGSVIGAEALLRWRHPERGIVPAFEFIPTAEETGLIHALGEHCLRSACEQSMHWSEINRTIRVSVNLSARQIEDGTIIRLLDELHANGRATGGASIDFEITETAMLERIENTREILALVKEKGHKLGVDDFGTGYSSMVYLQRFPVDRIKIDRSFVSRLDSSREAVAIITATVALAVSLGLDVIAEGVETIEQVKRLQELGCDLQQGYYYTAALPSDEFEKWVENRREALTAA